MQKKLLFYRFEEELIIYVIVIVFHQEIQEWTGPSLVFD